MNLMKQTLIRGNMRKSLDAHKKLGPFNSHHNTMVIKQKLRIF